ncbi:MAG: hypothetical protein RJA19_450 [Bacteroidota bacterium]
MLPYLGRMENDFLSHGMRTLGVLVALWGWGSAGAQCPGCTADPACTSSDGFPTICPITLPSATVGEVYTEYLTFFLPAEVVDPGSGVTATLNTVTIASITGVPWGMEVTLNDPDGVYTPAAGQTSGCATLCGTPLLAGTYDMVISIVAQVSAFGISQTVSDNFSLPLVVEQGSAATGSFTATPISGCAPVTVACEATFIGATGQTTTYAWTAGPYSSTDISPSFTFTEPGTYDLALTTTITQPVLTSVSLTGTSGAWSGGFFDDDLFSSPGDPYFILTDGSGTTLYTSSEVSNSTTANWSGLQIVLTNPPYTLAFWDADDISADEALGSVALPLGGGGFNAGNGTQGSVAVSVETVLSLTDVTQVTVLAPPVLEAGVSPVDPWVIEVQDGSAEGAGAVTWSWVETDAQGGVVGDEVGSGPTFAPGESGYWGVWGTNAFGCSALAPAGLFCLPGDVAGWSWDGETGELVTDPTGTATWYLGETPESGVELGTSENGWVAASNGWYSAQVVTVGTCTAETGAFLVCLPEPPLVVVPEGPPGQVVLSVVSELPAGYETLSWWWNGAVVDEGVAGESGSWLAAAAGWYAAQVTDGVGCSVVSDSVLVCLPFPPFELAWDPEGSVVTAPEGAAVYVWTLDGVVLPETGPVLNNPGLGVVGVEAIPFPGCPGTTAGIDLAVANAGALAGGWSAFPNPFTSQLTLQAPAAGRYRAQLLTAEGRCVAELPAFSGTATWSIRAEVPAGLYLLQFIDEQGRSVARVPLLRAVAQH